MNKKRTTCDEVNDMLFGKKLAMWVLTGILAGSMALPALAAQRDNFTDDMKITGVEKITQDQGAASIERKLDHKKSPYYAHPDFYHMHSKGSLTLLPCFKTIQQSSEWSCGPASALMVLNWYGRQKDWTEQKLAALRHPLKDVQVPGFPDGYPGTTLEQMKDMFQKVGGFDLVTTEDYAQAGKTFGPEDIKATLKAGKPILVGWIDWGGHWQVIIGYDDMGTADTQDDVLIVADPYDTTDHDQDGYGILPAARFFSTFDMYGQFPEKEGGNHNLFVIVSPAKP